VSDRLRGREALGVAVLRVALVPVVLFIGSNDPRPWSDQAHWTLLGAGVYAVAALALTARSSSTPPGGWRPYAVIDLIFVGLLAWQSGGAFSEMRPVLSALPFVVAFAGRPRATAAFSALTVAVYLLASQAAAAPADRGYTTSIALLLAWSGGLAVVLSLVITRARAQVLNLAAERQRLVADTQQAIDRERRRLAHRLHDDAIQNLQAARLELNRAERGNPTALTDVRAAITAAVCELRDTVAELRPADVERVGVSNALHQTARRLLDHTDTPTPQIDIDVTPDAEGLDDELWFSLARELLTNAIAHSHAQHIALTLTRHHDHITLLVNDDGQGLQLDRLRQARREGHIGLAGCAERAAAQGGTLDITSHPGRGTTVAITLPITHDATATNPTTSPA
jgi:two-component system NarL family sensor kinase